MIHNLWNRIFEEIERTGRRVSRDQRLQPDTNAGPAYGIEAGKVDAATGKITGYGQLDITALTEIDADPGGWLLS